MPDRDTSTVGPTEEDLCEVRRMLGREPSGRFDVVLRHIDGTPTVIRNEPLMDDGRPMPTRYWLLDPGLARAVARLESAGGVDRAEAEVDPVQLAATHDRYAAERDAAVPADHGGPRPHGGVGGTRVGVKCLHAHLAHHLADIALGGPGDPVGRWVLESLDAGPESSDMGDGPGQRRG